jgi:hypothetical protein
MVRDFHNCWWVYASDGCIVSHEEYVERDEIANERLALEMSGSLTTQWAKKEKGENGRSAQSEIHFTSWFNRIR